MNKRLEFIFLGLTIAFVLLSTAVYFTLEPQRPANDRIQTESIYDLRITLKESSPPDTHWRKMPGLVTHDRSGLAVTSASLPISTPIRIVTGAGNPFGAYYAEILRAEGLNLFGVSELQDLTPEVLATADMIVLTVPAVMKDTLDRLEAWVSAGGTLIVIRPEGALQDLAGLRAIGDAADGYVLFDPKSAPGRGIVRETLQLHVPSTKYDLKNSIALAHLYATATKALDRPAVTLRNVGRGHVVAYAYDLAQSIIRTRQGNPDWVNQERDGLPPRRANDLFFPDYTDMNKVWIPQADEHQRFFANLIVTLNDERRPLPRFWYLPGGRRAALILASDDHGTGSGTSTSFTRLMDESPPGCAVQRWECYRATSYLTPGTPMSSEEVGRFEALGFEIGVHVDTGCTDRDIAAVSASMAQQFAEFGEKALGTNRQETHRFHCIPWNGWVDTVKVERAHGIRMSLDYYYWPAAWVQGRQGFMTGSGIPMKFSDMDGTVLDIYQAATQIVDENGIKYADSISAMLRRAIGPEQFFGLFATHYDFRDDFIGTAIRAAKENGVALVSAAQALQWIDARNSSSFENIRWSENVLTFDLRSQAEADEMTVMLPLWSAGRRVSEIECDGERQTFHMIRIKGVEYASLPLDSGSCRAVYKGQILSSSN